MTTNEALVAERVTMSDYFIAIAMGKPALASSIKVAIDAYDGPYVFPTSVDLPLAESDRVHLVVGRILDDQGFYGE